jgi:hypothetical protein
MDQSVPKPKPGKDHYPWFIWKMNTTRPGQFTFPDPSTLKLVKMSDNIRGICTKTGGIKNGPICDYVNKLDQCCETCRTQKAAATRKANKQNGIEDVKDHASFLRKVRARSQLQFEFLSQYVNTSTAIIALCTYCGTTYTNNPARYYVSSYGCFRCRFMSHETFVQKANIVHNNRYEYNNRYVKSDKKMTIYCKNCKKTFEQPPKYHLYGKGCPNCRKSKGELAVENYLIAHSISFIPQKKFTGCKNKKELPFDFFIPDLNILIEYNGRQHFGPVEQFNGNIGYAKIKKHDAIKVRFCIESPYTLIVLEDKNTDSKYHQVPRVLNETFASLGINFN